MTAAQRVVAECGNWSEKDDHLSGGLQNVDGQRSSEN